MSPDNEYFWIDPEEAQALKTVRRNSSPKKSESASAEKGSREVPAVAAEETSAPRAEAAPPSAPLPQASVLRPAAFPAPKPTAPIPDAEHAITTQPEEIEEMLESPRLTSGYPPARESGGPSGGGLTPGATRRSSNFQARTAEERLEEFLEWVAANHAGAAVMVLTTQGRVVTARMASPELLSTLAGALPALVENLLPRALNDLEAVRVQRVPGISRDILDDGSVTKVLPVYCEPAGTVLCLVIQGAPDAEKLTRDVEALHGIFVDLVEAMVRG